MNRTLVHLGRIFLILFAYLAAAGAASAFFIFLAVVAVAGDVMDAQELGWALTGTSLVGVPVLAFMTAYNAFVPAMVAIVISEFFGKRDWLFHALAGAAVALVVVGMLGGEGSAYLYSIPVTLVLVACGLVGGIAYWLVAGRSAGGWGPPRQPEPPLP